ncbi:MAG TPA: DoxX family protein [Acetobacteraceae bacterium]|nr:DoxX family protein [Acetobacteraceae bacterium]
MDNGQNGLLLVGRIMLVVVFLKAGLAKITGWPGVVHYLTTIHAPYPLLGGIVAIVCEVVVAALIVLGVRTRLCAFIMALYTAGTMVLVHHFWTMSGPAQGLNELNFFKNLGLMGGFVLLMGAGPGRFALQRRG